MANSQTEESSSKSSATTWSAGISVRSFRPGNISCAPTGRTNRDPPAYRRCCEASEFHAYPEGSSPTQVEFSFSPLQTDEGVVVTCAIRDITERKKAEERIRELNSTLEERVLERTEALMRSNEELQQFAYHCQPRPPKSRCAPVSIYAQLLRKRATTASWPKTPTSLSGSSSKALSVWRNVVHELLDFSHESMPGEVTSSPA